MAPKPECGITQPSSRIVFFIVLTSELDFLSLTFGRDFFLMESLGQCILALYLDVLLEVFLPPQAHRLP